MSLKMNHAKLEQDLMKARKCLLDASTRASHLYSEPELSQALLGTAGDLLQWARQVEEDAKQAAAMSGSWTPPDPRDAPSYGTE